MSAPIEEIRELLRSTKPGSGDFNRDGDKFIGGNKLEFLSRGKDVYEAMWKAIEGAKETIHLGTYILRADKTGREFARRLEARARAGVRVRLIFDSIGSMGLDDAYVTRLRNAGVQVLEYHPVAPWRPRWSWGRRDHRKILVVDGAIAFTGGVNICDDHAPLDDGGKDWHDAHVRLEGPAAYDLDRLFRVTWFKETGRSFVSQGHPQFNRGESRVWIAANEEFLHRFRIRRGYLNALRAAQKEVLIANAYFVPDFRTRHALAAAVRRGVSVRILVPGRSDILSVWLAGRYEFAGLLRHGVRIHQWQGPILHEKTAVIDGTWCTIGSYNLDHMSLLRNLEVNLHILDKGFAARMRERFEADAAASQEIRLEDWLRRPLAEKALERFFYLFRYFL